MRWRHIIINTHGTWLHKDPRGFRSRKHKIHSSGDYRNPPPRGEHTGLHALRVRRSGPPVRLPRSAFPVVGHAILDSRLGQNLRVAAISVTPTRAHILVELRDHVTRVSSTVAWFKRPATRAVREQCVSLKSVSLWARGQSYGPVDSLRHQRAAFQYILRQQGADAWTWSYRELASK